DKLDRLITKIFPYVVLGCLILVLMLMAYLQDFTFTGIIFAICLGFVIGFVILGMACVFLSDTGVITGKYTVPVILIVPAVIAVLFNAFGSGFGPNAFIVKFFDILGVGTDLIAMLISVYSITLMIFFAAYGVVSVIVGYFRTYFYKVLRALEYPLEKRKNHVPEWLFQIPDIIDVKSVELEPEIEDGKFNVLLFRNIAVSLFLLGVVICSYIFINPLFLQVIPFEEMILIGVFISFFISPLVIPWSIVRSIGAKVKSDAPRDFYLWKGMRGRLYQGFFAVTFFMMLLTLSVYLGMDFSRIVTTYLGYISFMGIISIITSFVYVNTYYKGFKNGIIKSFLRAKEEQ
ncbi:hypothetical protein LJB91_02630, partial [Bacteroidales bacterium OttesenSCG-928-L03]|nr:hypothetical protein [Bacteroidales bacterium OttesenSCG-928-L03]